MSDWLQWYVTEAKKKIESFYALLPSLHYTSFVSALYRFAFVAVRCVRIIFASKIQTSWIVTDVKKERVSFIVLHYLELPKRLSHVWVLRNVRDIQRSISSPIAQP